MKILKAILSLVLVVMLCSGLLAILNSPTSGSTNSPQTSPAESLPGETTAEEVVTPPTPEAYDITLNLSHVQGRENNPTAVRVNYYPGATLYFTADSGYTLPEDVTVTGASCIWNRLTGKLDLSSPTEAVTVTVEAVEVSNVAIEGSWGDNRTAEYEIRNGGTLVWSGKSMDYFGLVNLYIDFTKDVTVTTSSPGSDRGFTVYNGSTVVAESVNNSHQPYTATIPAGTEFDRILFYDYN